MGMGFASVVSKGLNACSIYLMETLAPASSARCAASFVAPPWILAQRKMWGIFLYRCCLPFGKVRPGGPNGRMYPRDMHVPGHLHILYNALESAATQFPLPVKFRESLRVTQTFLSDTGLRGQGRASCLAGTEAYGKCASYSTAHIDWRW